MANMNILAIGASRNIGYMSAVRLLGTPLHSKQKETLIGIAEKGATVTFLLRNPSVFDADEAIQRFVRSGRAKLLKGNATSA